MRCARPAGKTRFEVADLLACSVRQLAEWLRLFRNCGVDALCARHHQGDPGVLHHLSDYRSELGTLMTEVFHIVAKEAISVEYREVA
jgi:hypothetical protein